MKPVRCGVVGFGPAGRIFHAAVISAVEGMELAGIVERSGNAAHQAYPHVPIYRSLEQMLTEGSLDLVAVATPNQSHAELARTCLLAGKHVIVDKPLTVTSGEAADLIQLAREQHRILTVYQNRRWDGDFLTVQKLIGSGALGILRSYESHFDRFRPALKPNAWRERNEPGAGILYDLGSHLIDQALVLFGPPEALEADIRAERTGAQVDDAFDLHLFYPEPIVWLRASSLASTPTLRFALSGTEGAYRKFGLDPQEDALRSGDLFHSQPWGLEPEASWGMLLTRSGEGLAQPIPTEPGDYRLLYRQLRDAILTWESAHPTPVPPGLAPVDPRDAWRTLRIIELAFESSRRGARVPCDWSTAP